MLHTLTTYDNLQQDPIEIMNYTVVQVYKDEISLDSALGYFIQPLEDVNYPDKVIDAKKTIEERVRETADPGGYEHLVILAGRVFEGWNRRIVYAVWYNGDVVPKYPDAPVIEPLGDPAEGADIYLVDKFVNDGLPTDCVVTVTLDRIDLPVEFYINDDYFKINVPDDIPGTEHIIIVDKTGVSYNSVPIDTFEILSIPTILHGENIIKSNKMMIDKIKITYTNRF